MEGIKNLIQLCVWLGTLGLCVVLVISGVLRWLAHPEKREKRLNYAGWIAFAVLSVTLLRPGIPEIIRTFGNEEGNTQMTHAVINISKATVKLVILGTVVLAVVVVLLVLIVIIAKGIAAIVRSKDKNVGEWANMLDKTSQDFRAVTKTPVFTFLLTCGILIAFVILPFLMGSPDSTGGLAVTWESGIKKILEIVLGQENRSPDVALITYILLFIIVLGVGFTIIKIIHTIIKNNLKERNSASIIDEYAGSMGILGVGVSILFALQDTAKQFFEDKLLNLIYRSFLNFVIVALFMALVIVVLEIIRLILDMRETLIRRESKYLFIALTGQVSLLVFSMMYIIYSALNSAIGGKLNINMERIQNKLIQHMMDTMEEAADSEAGHHKTTFTGFKGKVTKK